MLRNLLGISVQRQSSDAMAEEQYQYLFAEDLEDLPNVHVEVENEPESDTEVYLEGENRVGVISRILPNVHAQAPCRYWKSN